MNYFRVTSALKRIVEFRDLYLNIVEAQNEGNSDAVWQIRQQLARLSAKVQRDLVAVQKGYFTLMDAPALGGRRHVIEAAALAFDIETASKYHVGAGAIVLNFERAIGEYQRLIKTAFWNLFNPLWWIRGLMSSIVSLPFYLIGIAGFDQTAIESSPGGRVFKLLGELAMVVAALITLYEFLIN